MTIEKKLLATNPVSGVILPEAVSFDGTNDYLSRSSDMTNNADGKTFTFSCWVYIPSGYAGTIGVYNVGSFWIQPDKDGGLGIVGYGPSGGNPAFYSNLPANSIPLDTYSNILVSINVNGGVSTRLRHVYINDVNVTPANADWYESEGSGWYNDKLINFTPDNGTIRVGANATSQKLKGRLAHVFLDYTYRDLSVTANRRLFIDADGKPSSTIPSSPILYLPMKDAATAGSNSGTGGDFTVNGVLATAERGPNQDNCSASKFDGSNDYLFRSSIVGISSSKQFTLSFNFVHTGGSSGVPMEFRNTSGTYKVRAWQNASSYNIYIQNNNSAVVVAHISNADYKSLNIDTGYKQNNVSISFDLSDTSKRYVYLNGTAATVTWETYTNQLVDMSQINNWRVGNSGTGTAWWNGQLGEVYFNTAYTDLATSNPFWDSDTNRPNSVRKVIADTSVTPLIALPIIGNNAGKNFGSGGDFTVNSGPYVGARGGSEFWARSIYSAGNSQFLQSTSLSAMSQFTMVAGLNMSRGGNSAIVAGNSGATYFDSEQAVVRFWNSNNEVVRFGVSTNYTSGWNTLMVSVNLSTNTAYCYINGTSIPILSNNMSSYSNADFNPLKLSFEGNTSVSSFYLDDSYINFSQEANRNKFVNQLGYLKDLTTPIEDGDVVEPLVYMKFDPSSFVTNSGTGSNFTNQGTGVLSDSDFNL